VNKKKQDVIIICCIQDLEWKEEEGKNQVEYLIVFFFLFISQA
jgi:hypothetical protein